MKDNLPQDTVIILLDFSMNYSCTEQDAFQSYHWSKRQVTLHTIVAYYKDNNFLKHKSFCILSDDLDHDLAQVYLSIEYVTNYMKNLNPHLQKVEYFSDGCAQQYKNCNLFLLVCTL